MARVSLKKKESTKNFPLIFHKRVFVLLLLLVLLLGSLNVAKAKGWLIPTQPEVVVSEGKRISLSEMTLEQKIAQMIVVAGGTHNMDAWKNMQLGGIHLFAKKDGEVYKKTIADFQNGMNVPFFVTVDLEGCLNPFAEFHNSTALGEIHTVGEAFQKGSDEGKLLQELGFSVNFAPVVDLHDQIWKCRVFEGDEKKISELAEAYSLGLQSQGIIATAKHYPGKALEINDPHKYLVSAGISESDLYPYEYLSNKKAVNAVMVTHVIASGLVDSEGKPAVASSVAIGKLKETFSGLVVTDDTMMWGLRKFYSSKEQLYIEVFKSGNDLILNFDEDPAEIYHMIQVVKGAVEKGEISADKIDGSVRKILEAKGFVVE
jgi:beta-N-acetylhexosaminidase